MGKSGKPLFRVAVPLMVVGLVLALGTASAAFKHIHRGMEAPAFEAKDVLEGGKVAWKPGSGAGNEGAVAIVFWATWSPRSLELLEDLKAFSSQYGQEKFRVIAINVDAQDVSGIALKEIRNRTVDMDLPFPVVIDKGLKIFHAYGVIAVPSLALLDADGTIRYDPSGYSFEIRDRLVDSTEVVLGLKSSVEGEAQVFYRPDPVSSRLYHLAGTQADKRKFDQALESLGRAIGADPGFGAPHILTGRIHLTRGDAVLAEEAFARATGLDSTLVAAWAGRGEALLAQGKAAEAVMMLGRALALDEAFTPAILDLAECRLLLSAPDQADDLIRAALDLNPHDPGVLCRVGQLQRQAGKLEESVVALRHAMEILVSPSMVAK